jgi:hypothetical protein
MGLADRDYMGERRSTRRNPFNPPQPPGTSTVTFILTWLLVAYLLFQGFAWWQNHHTLPLPTPAPQQAQPRTPNPGPVLQPEPRPRTTYPSALQTPAAPGPTQVSKCVSGGHTSYSQGPCPTGATASTLQLQAAPAAPTSQAVAVQAPPQPVIVTQAPQVVIIQNQPTVDPNVARLQECKALEAEIVMLDNWARQLLPAQEQDRIRERRRKARDRQFEIHC